MSWCGANGGCPDHVVRHSLFPRSGIVIAERVDARYFFLLGVGFLLGAHRRAHCLLRRQVPPPQAGTSASSHGGLLLEVTWTVIPLLITMVIFGWGASVFFAMTHPPDDTLNIYVVGKQWMWKFSISTASGDRQAARPRRPEYPPHRDLRGRDPRRVRPGVSRQADVIPGRYVTLWFRPTKAGGITCSARNIAARSIPA
jgi:cytochrome c oxidase subunit 2